MISYIVREDEKPELLESNGDEKLNTNNILKEKYPYILECMKKEGFKPENNQCQLFKEVLHEKKVVGFITYNFDGDLNDLSLVNVYVIPEYRGNNILYNELSSLLEKDISLNVLEPNNLIIDLFLKYGFAEKLNEYLVASSIPLDVSSEKYISNTDEFTLDPDSFYSSNLYDTDISATLLLIDISTPGSNIICYSKTLESDKVNYDAEKHRKKIKSHLKNVKKDMLENSQSFSDTLIKLKENLPKPRYDINKLVGKPPELSSILKAALGEGIREERVKEIQEQLIEEYDEGIVRNESLFKRLTYLLLEDEMDDEDLWEYNLVDASCPYCYNPINLSDISCRICGYNLQYSNDNDMELIDQAFEELMKQITNVNALKNVMEIFSKPNYSLNSSIESEEITPLSIATVKIITLLNDLTPLDKACEYASVFTNYDSSTLQEHMIKEGYVEKEISKDNWNILANNMKVPQLKDILRKNGQKISGKKQELIERIEENVDLSTYIPSDLIEQEYIITKKAINYLNENKYLLLSGNMLEGYDLLEYKNFLKENNYEDSYQTQLSFLELHEQKALEENDQGYIKTVLESKRAIYEVLKMNNEEVFVNELKIYSLNLNQDFPFLMGFYDVSKAVLETSNVKQLRKLFNTIRYPYESMMLEIYDNTPYEKKYTVDNMVLILDDIFKGINLSTIRSNLYKYQKNYQSRVKNLDDYF